MQPQCPWPDAPNTYSFSADKLINLQQLQSELTAICRWGSGWNFALQSEEDDAGIHGYLWIDFGSDPVFTAPSPSSPVMNQRFDLVRAAIAMHVYDPKFGLSPFWRQYNEIQDRVFHDPEAELSAEELNILVKGLVLKSQFPPQED